MNINCIENRILNANGILQPTILRAILNLYNGGLHLMTARIVREECYIIDNSVDWNGRLAAICNAMRNTIECGGTIVGEDIDCNDFTIEYDGDIDNLGNMKITIIDEDPCVLDGKEDFLNKKIHIVCVAVNALTIFNVYAATIGEMLTEEATRYANTVNRHNETGTLFPKLNLTIVPLTIFENRNDTGNRNKMQKIIIDCLDSNEKYIKCTNLIFALERRSDFDRDTALEVLKAIVNNYKFVYTKRILFYNL